MLKRRQFLQSAALLAGGAALTKIGVVPAWARAASAGNTGITALTGNMFDLNITKFPIKINGRTSQAVGVNGTVPGPLLRWREGEHVTMNVRNGLSVDSSIHWHGLLVPFQMDGVPGVTFPGIKAGETFKYEFHVPQNGTYWYHSHSGLQEQVGHYGPLIIDPAGTDPVAYDREYVLVLGDWSFTDPHRVFSMLKKNAESLNRQQRTVGDFLEDAGENGLGEALGSRSMWGAMRMNPRDLSDVTGTTYTYVINGHSTLDNFNMVFEPGERVRLRIINAAAMTLFNVRMPGLPMTVVQADGLHVRPIETDEFQMGVAETYDVIVEPKDDRAYAFVAESIDRSGQVVATLGTHANMRASEPRLRPVPVLTMQDMGMDHSAHGGMSMGDADKPEPSRMDHAEMGHGTMNHVGMDHSMHGPDPDGPSPQLPRTEADLQLGPGVVNIAAMPTSRLSEPGIGLEDVPHRTLTYADLRSLEPNPDLRPPSREHVVHLTANMERYMWSFDGVKFSEVTEPIVFHQGERVRLTLINNTMMPHPIHLHGMFFDLVNGGGNHRPRKHTVIVKPSEKLSVDISAEHVGDWAFHCHLIYHMHAGMMQVVSVMPHDGAAHSAMKANPETIDHQNLDHSDHHSMDHSKHGESKR